MARTKCPMCGAAHPPGGGARGLAALRRAPARLARTLRAVPARLAARRPGRGEWSVTEVVSHLADAEIARVPDSQDRVRSPARRWPRGIRTAGPRALSSDHAARGARTFAALRRANLAYVGRLGAAQKRQHGRHPAYGRLTIPQMLAHWAEHDVNQLEQIRTAHRHLRGRRP